MRGDGRLRNEIRVRSSMSGNPSIGSMQKNIHPAHTRIIKPKYPHGYDEAEKAI